MGKTVMILPQKGMAESARKVLAEFPGVVDEVLYLSPPASAAETAQRCINAGADLIVARGLQAKSIEENCHIPVVAIRLTGQEIAVLVHRIKKLCPVPRPKIALLGADNMFPDLTAFNELFDVDLIVGYCDPGKPGSLAEKAVAEGVDAVIGGVLDVEYCRERGIPALLHASTEDSLREAIKTTMLMRNLIEQRKQQEAKSEALFSSAFNGFLHLDDHGIVLRCNVTAEQLLGLSEHKILGVHISALFPNLDMDRYNEAVATGTVLSDFATVKRQNFATIIRPLGPGKEQGGVIFSFRKTVKDLSTWNSSQTPSRTSFAVATDSPAMKKCVQTAKSFCMSARPVLIIGEPGTDTSRLARCIHANSDCSKNGPMISADCACWTDADQQAEYLFGYSARASGEYAAGMIGLARDGSLFLDRIEALAHNVQHRLWQALCNKRFIYIDSAPAVINFRLIARSTRTLQELTEEGLLLPELYHMLAPMSFVVPPLRETPEDLPQIIESTFGRLCNEYHRFLTLTPEAMNQLCSYPWEGNATQLHLFLERLVISSDEQNISRALVKTMMRDIYSNDTQPALSPEPPRPSCTPEEMRVISALRKCRGDREATARELGISKTTLWRWMKKYDISTKY